MVHGTHVSGIIAGNGFSSKGKYMGIAPGIGINSLANRSSEYKELSGTSMAAPVVAGCAALLYEKNPRMTPLEIKKIIMDNADNPGPDPNKQGSGLLNIKKIIDAIKAESPENKHDDSHSHTRLNINPCKWQ